MTCAASQNYHQEVRVLLRYITKNRIELEGISLLHLAVKYDRSVVVEKLIAYGAEC